jgi:hypothetical protein
MKMKSRTQDFLEKLKAAKTRDCGHSRFVGFARAFCPNSLCPAREIDVRLDCIGGDPTTIACPLCGREPAGGGEARTAGREKSAGITARWNRRES